MTPYTVRNKFTNQSQPVPCGKCPDCKRRRVSGWSFRLLNEARQSSSAHFITLTYDTINVPITKSGFMDLSRRDLQLFFKKLRKVNVHKIKYYVCGEYGGRTMRPHYHLLLFNAEIRTVQDAWAKGSLHYGLVTDASVGYTLKYMCKSKRIPLHRNDDRIPEFSLMSKGLGLNYVTDDMIVWHHADKDNRMYCNLPDNKKIAMPRYYKQKIYTDEQRKAIGYVTRQRQLKEESKQIKKQGDKYYHKKAASDMAEFNRMNHESKGRDKL